jgi:hypothetical protein
MLVKAGTTSAYFLVFSPQSGLMHSTFDYSTASICTMHFLVFQNDTCKLVCYPNDSLHTADGQLNWKLTGDLNLTMQENAGHPSLSNVHFRNSHMYQQVAQQY